MGDEKWLGTVRSPQKHGQWALAALALGVATEQEPASGREAEMVAQL